ncbi:MFS transporter [Dactylosporangium sp. NPDC051541]|uniref:MFS transporter n=1 Tax=Dactylosporangium sp. NPDC051541 TaxID=3363977 RepID=UPI00379BDA04
MSRTPTLAFLLVTVAVDMLGLGLVVPVLPSLLSTVTGDAATGALWSGWIGASFGVTQFVGAPLLGRLSDRYGRKPVLVGAMLALGLDWLAHATASRPLTMLAAHAFAGALGGTVTVVNAYIADVTEPEHRAKGFGYVGAAFSVGFVAGPVIGGLLGAVNPRLPFFAAAALAGVNALYGALVLPESRPGDRSTSLAWRVANPVGAILGLARRPGLGHLTAARLLGDIARMTNQCTWTFVMMHRFGWSPAVVGGVMAASALLGAVVSATLSGPYVRRLGVRRAAIVSAWAGAVSLAGFGLAGSAYIVPFMVLGSVAALGGTATQTWITTRTGADEHGAVQGALTGIAAIAEAGVPAAATAVFAYGLTVGAPGLILVLAAVVGAASAVVLAQAPSAMRRPPQR